MTRREFQRFAARKIIRLDGATGTELAKLGMPPGVSPEKWCLENPDAIIKVQRSYREAGSEIIYAPSFGGNPIKLAEFGLEERTAEINTALAELSRKACPGTLIFGDIAPTGILVEPFGPLAFEDAVDIYRRQVSALAAGGVDGFAIETMMSLQEARAALFAVKEAAPELPVIVTMTFEKGGRTLTGDDPVSALLTLQALGADAFGCNCSTGPVEMAGIIKKLKPYAKIPLIAKPNAGMPHLSDGETVFDLGPEEFAAAAGDLVAAGAGIIGGCCGTTPAHIAALSRVLEKLPAPPIKAAVTGVVCSNSRFRHLAPDAPFTLIGERINPTGKKALQAEIRAGSMAMVKTFAAEQEQSGAHILDVNFGLGGIDEAATMRQAVGEIVRSSTLPLCIDTVDAKAAEAALRLYPGRALFNSISAEKNRLEQLLPVMAKYGAVPILLPLSDAGIPETAGERMDILRLLIRNIAAYGYTPEECAADLLVMTVSASPEAPANALKFLKLCRKEFNCNTVCGLSNVSFGLPNRPAVNAAFLGIAAGCGLNMAIANPSAPGIADFIPAADALLGKDPELSAYLAYAAAKTPAGGDPAAAHQTSVAALPPTEMLSLAVINGRREETESLIDSLIAAGEDPSRLVNDILIPAITEVGNRFERKEFYLPQLMQSADAMSRGMSKLEPLLLKNSDAAEQGPLFIIATVEGDIHDIGKNILALLLRNHNFRVMDLGRNVSAATILEAVKTHRPEFLGLSALMTTTMPRMKEVIELLRSEGIQTPVFVGGAAVDEVYAGSIGGYYGADAMASVRLALELLNKKAQSNL